MVNPLSVIKNNIAPPPEEIWKRGGATMRSTEIDKNRHEEVPFFDLEISKRTFAKPKQLVDSLDRVIGHTHDGIYITNDKIDRSIRLHLPENEFINHEFDFIIQLNTAWFTSIDGHNNNTAQMLAEHIGVPVLEIGPEHSSRQMPFPLEGLRLAKTFKSSSTISLAKSAQSAQMITADLCDQFSLPKNIVKIGESRGAMIAPGEYPYADLYNNKVIYMDTTAPCVPDQMFSHKSDLLRLGQAPVSEILGTLVVGIEANRKKATNKFLGTISLNPNFIMSSLVGIMPALASGEAGRFAAWVPAERNRGNIHIVTFKNDLVSRPRTWKELYSNNPGVAIITLDGTHVTLAHTETLRHIIERINNFGKEYSTSDGNLNAVNWANVHLKDADKFLKQS